jgi:hypothetical protein
MNMETFKKPQVLAVIGLLIAVAIGGTVFAFSRSSAPAEETTEDKPAKRKISEPVNQIDISERPYVTIVPQADGRNLDLVVNQVKKDANSVEYELEYQAGTLLQGAFGLIELTSFPSTTRILLGSCSAGGACTYHEDVQGGSLVLRFEGTQTYALKQEWRYFDNYGSTQSEFASKDAKFQVESADLGDQRFVVIYNSPGYPEGLEGTPVSDPYSVQGTSTLTGTAELTMRATTESELTIMGYDGTAWQSFDTTTDGKTATATVDLMELFIVVSN